MSKLFLLGQVYMCSCLNRTSRVDHDFIGNVLVCPENYLCGLFAARALSFAYASCSVDE